MADLLGICGIKCSDCDAYIATINNDTALKIKLAKKISEQFGKDVKPEEIYCVGCYNEGTHFGYCAECGIRICGLEKKVLSCAYCDEYPCPTLIQFFDMVPEAKKNLDEIYKNSR